MSDPTRNLFGSTAEYENEFKRQFVTQFLASYTAIKFDDYCARDLQEKLCEPAIEDAMFLANEVWDRLQQ